MNSSKMQDDHGQSSNHNELHRDSAADGGSSLIIKEEMKRIQAQREFETSRDGKIMSISLFFMSLSLMWGYYTMLNSQSFFQSVFPDSHDIAFETLMCMTLPESGSYLLTLLSGIHRTQWLGFTARVVSSQVLYIVVTIVYLIALIAIESQSALRAVILMVAATISFGQYLIEPALYEVAGLMPSTETSRQIANGTGFSGFINQAVVIIIMLGMTGTSGSAISVEASRIQQVAYVCVFLAMAILTIVVWFVGIKRNPYYIRYVIQDIDIVESNGVSPQHRNDSDSEGSSPKPVLALEAGVDTAERVKDTKKQDFVPFSELPTLWKALKVVWKQVITLWITYGTSLMCFPVIPGAMCVADPKLQAWWFQIVLVSFNLLDCLSRTRIFPIAWGIRHITPNMQLILASVRALIICLLLFTGAAPQRYSPEIARWVVLVAVLFMGVTNGYLSTVAISSAPKTAMASGKDIKGDVVQYAGGLGAMGLFLGISTGTILAYILGQGSSFSSNIGQCYTG